MRELYNQRLNAFNHNQRALADLAHDLMSHATEALLTSNLELAESIVARADEVDELKDHGEQAAFAMLALEAPVARDLRHVVSGIHIVGSFARMALLGIHVAKVARRRHPQCAVPDELRPRIEQMSSLGCHAALMVTSIMEDADPQKALALEGDDDQVDRIHHELFNLATAKDWPYSAREAVDVTQLSRMFERYSDHAVSVGNRVIFMATAMQPEEFAQSVAHPKRPEM
ncbi:PhoU family transcriptional regulator [Corynebacterium sp. 320]|uniref:phosphate signaling complex PhoU family protein n=1 Tax=Corynebacterium TaxID=1716 RepID=UPI00125CCF5A|nr:MULTISPECIES: PhoU domain-containing protein [Corynebacterium]KAB1502991.1 PhoU family transcriptional regulator [Corynebacterium sp. 320]KAB1550798.1 PhoU family transcriptional regulator [Corynebacterium sp. 321]KAB1551155.1 PhoU family transcriptional regulator [Corynebacterium sp. 319]KAB3526788.1 PhoU family transcriptional regulator [Corynebacterium sp. 250]KAB3538283.1 PhoU family transcriptional regulator [Corynebacterium sp. 366]